MRIPRARWGRIECMDKTRESHSVQYVPIAVLATLLLIFGGYTAGYFAATKGVGTAPPNQRVRVFHARWQAILFSPGTRIESLLVGEDISAES